MSTSNGSAMQNEDKNPRQVWFITYGASGPNITHEMLEEGLLSPEECYTVRGRDFKYTLLRLSRYNRVRHNIMDKFLELIEEKFGIIKNQIFGYDSIVGNAVNGDRIGDHPGFMLMKEQMNHNSDSFVWWIKEGRIESKKSGLLWKFRTDIDPVVMPRSMLIEKAKDNYKNISLSQKLSKDCEDLQVSNQLLQDEIDKLKKRVSRQHEIIREYREFVEENGYPAGKFQRME